MLKIVAILAIFYFFFRFVGFVLRLLLGGNSTSRSQNPFANQQQQTRTKAGLHVDSIPKNQKKKSDFSGGDYVDYEEVK